MRAVSLSCRTTLILVATLAACSSKKPEAPPPAAMGAATVPTDSTGAPIPQIPAAERVVLDSANIYYRSKNYPMALVTYRRAAVIAPTDVAPWFGVYMVATATQNKVLGDSAIAEMRARGGTAPGQATDSALQAAHKGAVPGPTSH